MIDDANHGLYSVHVTARRRAVRKHICFKSSLVKAERVADKLVRASKGATVEIFKEQFNTGAELVSIVCGGQERKQKERIRKCA